ncbi:MAG: hypothetical protein WCV00_05090 [Verrucomicrobiia bacterium]|jgi:hypothetical protein
MKSSEAMHIRPIRIPDINIPVLRDPAIVAGERQSVVMHHLMSGVATFDALKKAVAQLVADAPTDHDVVIAAFGISVVNVHFLQPHSFLFSGFDEDGNKTAVVVHYSQMVARVVYLPKRGKNRVITGFAVDKQ